MTNFENRPEEALEKHDVQVFNEEVILERTGGHRVILITGGKRLVFRSHNRIHTHWEDEDA